MIIRDICPQCQSPKYKKNGHIHNGKQNDQCKDCGRQFVDCFAQDFVSDDTRALIERLLVERISLRGTCRAVGVTLKWLLGFLVGHCQINFPICTAPAQCGILAACPHHHPTRISAIGSRQRSLVTVYGSPFAFA